MQTSIKEQVKSIFKMNAYEVAMELCQGLYLDYIREYGLKSWNSMAAYYKKAAIQHESTKVAELDTSYNELAANSDDCKNNDTDKISSVDEKSECEIKYMEVTPESVVDLHNALADIFGEEKISASLKDKKASIMAHDNDTIKYMIYRNNLADKLDWFGHRENFFNLKVGDTARIIRMNSCGVSEGTVVAVADLTLEQIDLFHKCYKEITKSHNTYPEKFVLSVECLNKIGVAIHDVNRAPKKPSVLLDYVLNFGK